MYPRRNPQAYKQRKAMPKKFGAPTAGWISNRALSNPASIEGQGAAILDNFFPKATSVTLRRGKQIYATLGDGTTEARSLFTYSNGPNERMFGANDTTIYDLSTIIFPENTELSTEDGDTIVTEDGDFFGWSSTGNLSIPTIGPFTSGDWVTTQFATSGGVYLIGVNGVDTGFLYDGADFYPLIEGGVKGLSYDALIAPFAVGEVVTGATSAATGTIVYVRDTGGATGTLWLRDVTGTFQDNEAISSTAGGATVNGVLNILAPGVVFPAALTTADMSYVWIYKNRIWFARVDTMDAYYVADADSLGGTAEWFPLSGVFTKGGSLLFGATWSIDGNNGADLSEQNIFVSSLGEVAVYQGIDPGQAATWGKVGLYQTGRPLGKRAHFRGGGDIAIATSIGLVPLSKAVSLDITSLAVAMVSYKIADAWSEATSQRGFDGWQCNVWPEAKMALIAPPDLIGSTAPVVFISNTETGAWARFTGWNVLCMATFRGQLFFGSENGKIFQANVSGRDENDTYSGSVVPLFEDLENPSSLKIGTVGRAVVRANTKIQDCLQMMVDYDTGLSAAPDASSLNSGDRWGAGVWGQSVWNSGSPPVVNQQWRSLGGAGYAVSLAYQITSGGSAPLDADLVQMEIMYTTAEMVT